MKSFLLYASVVMFSGFGMACDCSKGACSNHGGAKACAGKTCDMKGKSCACSDEKHSDEKKDKKKNS